MFMPRRAPPPIALIAVVLAAIAVPASRHFLANAQSRAVNFPQATSADPASPACRAQSPGAQPSASASLERQTTLLCYSEYVARYSGLSRTPIWSAERLTRARIAAAKDQIRENRFHPDPSLSPDQAASLADYRSGGAYERGHMAPNGDGATEQGTYEMFSLANIVPQNPTHNRHLWADIETNVRYLTNRSEVYVVTGPLFVGSQLTALNERVLVPTHLYKAIYAPHAGIAGVYVSPNSAAQTYERLTIAEFKDQFGISPFPDMPADLATAARPPEIRRYR